MGKGVNMLWTFIGSLYLEPHKSQWYSNYCIYDAKLPRGFNAYINHEIKSELLTKESISTNLEKLFGIVARSGGEQKKTKITYTQQ